MRLSAYILTAGVSLALASCMSSGGTKVADKPGQSRDDAAQVWVQLGQKYMEMGKLELAKQDLLKALEFDSKNVDAHTVLATLYDRVGDHTSAEAHYHSAVEIAPKSGITNNNYGLYLCKLGKFDLAQKYFDIAVADGFYNQQDTAYTNAGTCLMMGNGSLDKAEADFRRAIEINAGNTQALFQLARVLYQKTEYFKARAFIQRYDALGQANPDALLLARNIEVKLGHADAARDYAQRLREQFPDSEQTHSLETATPSS